MKDNETIARIREGDEEVIDQTYRQYRQEFIRWMRKKYAVSDEEAREFYQEIFCRFLVQVQNGKLTYITFSLKTYLFGIGRNLFSEKKRKDIRFDHEIDEERIADSNEDSIQKKEREVDYYFLEKSLQLLDANHQRLLEMFYYENKSMDYIALKLGYKNAASAKNQKYRCMEKVRKMLESYKEKN